jgi:hypothetical protein
VKKMRGSIELVGRVLGQSRIGARDCFWVWGSENPEFESKVEI